MSRNILQMTKTEIDKVFEQIAKAMSKPDLNLERAMVLASHQSLQDSREREFRPKGVMDKLLKLKKRGISLRNKIRRGYRRHLGGGRYNAKK